MEVVPMYRVLLAALCGVFLICAMPGVGFVKVAYAHGGGGGGGPGGGDSGGSGAGDGGAGSAGDAGADAGDDGGSGDEASERGPSDSIRFCEWIPARMFGVTCPEEHRHHRRHHHRR